MLDADLRVRCAAMNGRMMDFPLTLTHLLERARRLLPDDRDRQPRSRRLAPPARLGPGLRAHGEARPRARAPRREAGRPRGDARVEPPPPPRGVLRGADDGRRRAHAEPAAAPERDRLHRAPRRGLGRPGRPVAPAALRPVRGERAEPPARHRACPDAGPDARGQARLRGAPRARARRSTTGQASTRTSPAQICYTSGTTGNPKGVVYSHRSSVLHALAACLTDSLGMSMNDTVLPVVPMFHANAWGLPHACAAVGAKLVFPGPKLDPESLLDLMAKREGDVRGRRADHLARHPRAARRSTRRSGTCRRCGRWSSAARRRRPSMIDGFQKRHGLTVTHAWGMTETNPLGTIARRQAVDRGARATSRALARARLAGLSRSPFVETRHVDDDGQGPAVGRRDDGRARGARAVGRLVVPRRRGQGPLDEGRLVQDRRRRDASTARGTSRITDRSKDVIKSGGEWISSVALENALMSHPAVLEAAVFAGRHPKWDERPIAAVVLKKGMPATEAELAAHLEGRVREVLAARRLRLRGADPADVDRQVPEDQAARDLRRAARGET